MTFLTINKSEIILIINFVSNKFRFAVDADLTSLAGNEHKINRQEVNKIELQ